jgi:hypothetical protein
MNQDNNNDNLDPVPDPDPSINNQKNGEKPSIRMFCDFLMTCYL